MLGEAQQAEQRPLQSRRGEHRGEADPAPGSSLPTSKTWVLHHCASCLYVHWAPLLLDALEGENAFSFCLGITVPGRIQSSINRLT